MAAIDRLLRANRTVLLVPVVDIDGEPTLVGVDNSLAPFAAPTAALLEGWRTTLNATATAASHGGNISGAVLDDMDLGLGASSTDNELVLTSIGNEVTPTYKTVDATLTVLRDKNKADTGVFNLATKLVVAADVRYAIVDRIGYVAGEPFAVGQIVSLYEVHTDNPVDQKADRANLKVQQVPVPSGVVTSQYQIAA